MLLIQQEFYSFNLVNFVMYVYVQQVLCMIVSNIVYMLSIKRKGKKKFLCFFVWKISILLYIKIV